MLGRAGELNAFRHDIFSVQRVYQDITHGKFRSICTQKILPPATIAAATEGTVLTGLSHEQESNGEAGQPGLCPASALGELMDLQGPHSSSGGRSGAEVLF